VEAGRHLARRARDVIGDPDAKRKTSWSVFYGYRHGEEGSKGAGELVELFSTYRNDDVQGDVRFDAAAKTASVAFITKGKRSSKEDVHRLELAPVPTGDDACALQPAARTAAFGGATRHEGRYRVDSKKLEGGVTASARLGGCGHVVQTWRFSPSNPGAAAKQRVHAAVKLLRSLGSSRGDALATDLETALKKKRLHPSGVFDCGRGVCGVTVTTEGGVRVLVVDYRAPL
jgi:hypothetical protein